MIYLFSNRSYGAPFLDAAARYSRRTGAPITAVFSGHRGRERQENGAVAALRSLTARWRTARAPAAAGLPLLIVDDVNVRGFADSIERDDAGIIAGFDQIFSSATIARFNSLVNVHPSLLPYYRGPEPAYWCIDNGETATGFTIHTVTPRIDDGEIHYQETLRIDPDEDAAALTTRIALRAVGPFECWLDHLVAGTAWTKRTIDAGSVYRRHVGYKSFHDKSASPAQ